MAGMTASAKGDREQPGKQVRQKAGLNRAILDVAFSELARQIEYKAEWYGRTVLKVDRFYPSSKTCSACGHRLDELRLDVREWTCPKCGIEHDRDINAARNILREGLKRLTPGGTGEVRASGGEGGLAPWPCQRESSNCRIPVRSRDDDGVGEFRLGNPHGRYYFVATRLSHAIVTTLS